VNEVAYDVEDPGAPRLDGAEDGDQVEAAAPDELGDQVAKPSLMPSGWTEGEAARVVGGMVAGLTTVLYAMRYRQPPAVELVPAIAGDPEREFPLLGMSLAPILDMMAPKGSPAAIGVGLGAGLSELLGAVARRAPVLATPPAGAGAPLRVTSAPTPAPAPPAAEDTPGNFRFTGADLEVLRGGPEPAYAGFGW